MAETVSFLSFSCTHHPFHDPEAIDWLLGHISSFKPDFIIHKGDGHEAIAASKFPNEERVPLLDEFKSHNAFLRDIRLAASEDGVLKSRLIFLPGNHDDNILAQGRINPDLREMCDYHHWEPELVEHWEEPATYEYSRRGVFKLGQVVFGHGWETGQNADEFHAITFCEQYGLYLGGHLHRPSGVRRAMRTAQIPLPFWHGNTGCLRDMNPYYMRRNRKHLWGQAISMGHCELTKSPRTKRHWDAHIEVFRMSEDLM